MTVGVGGQYQYADGAHCMRAPTACIINRTEVASSTGQALLQGGGTVHKNLFISPIFFILLYVLPVTSSSTQYWGSVLPSIVETIDQNSRGCPLSLFG